MPSCGPPAGSPTGPRAQTRSSSGGTGWSSRVWPGHWSAGPRLSRSRSSGSWPSGPRPRPRPSAPCWTSFAAQITADLDRLDAERAEQLTLFNEPEREQSQRDLDALRRRLGEIPDEIEREVAAVRRRFTDPESHIFPAAVTILVPEEPA